MKSVALSLLAVGLLTLPEMALARDNLGVFDDWGAFRDPATPRCYAIAAPDEIRTRKTHEPFAAIGNWPRRNVRGQFHIRLSRDMARNARITLSIDGRSFILTGGGGDAWAQDKRMDAAIIAAMRSGREMQVDTTAPNGATIRDHYRLRGAATAIDAAALACANVGRSSG
jgi:hypothetical protein